MIGAALNVDTTKFHTNLVPPVPAHPLHAHVVRAACTAARPLLKNDFNTRLGNDRRRTQRRHHQVPHEPRAAVLPHPLHAHVVRAAISCTAARPVLKKDFDTLQCHGLEPSWKWGNCPKSNAGLRSLGPGPSTYFSS